MKSTEGDVGYFEVNVASGTAGGEYMDWRIEENRYRHPQGGSVLSGV